LARYFRRLPRWLRRLAPPIVNALPNSARKESPDYKLRKFIEGAEFPADKAHYTWRTIFSDPEKLRALSPEFLDTVQNESSADCYRQRFADANASSDMDRIF